MVARELGVPWRTAESMHWYLGETDMARRAGVTPFTMAAASGPSPSSNHPPSGLNAPMGASIHSPGGTRSGVRSPGSLGGPLRSDLPPIHEGLTRSLESGWRDERDRRRRAEGGKGRGTTVLPSVAELEGGVRAYDEEDDEEEEDDDEQEEEDEEEEE